MLPGMWILNYLWSIAQLFKAKRGLDGAHNHHLIGQVVVYMIYEIHFRGYELFSIIRGYSEAVDFLEVWLTSYTFSSFQGEGDIVESPPDGTSFWTALTEILPEIV